jgi:hypothetical protein
MSVKNKVTMDQVRQLRQAYPTYFESITKIINVLDPCGLVDGGAPEDEHEVLVGAVLRLIINDRVNEVKELIINAYDWYGMGIMKDYTDEDYPRINKTVLQIIEIDLLYQQNNHN